MSMTLTDMATEVAKSIGGQNTGSVVNLARLAIKASIRDWNVARDWNFLLKDTVAGFSVAAVSATAGSPTVSAPLTGAFDAVNIGVAVTSTGTATLVADTTVLSFTRNVDGTVATITLSNNFGGTNGIVVLAFSGNIPIRPTVNEYNLPTDFSSPYNARTLTQKRLLEYIKYREWNIKVVDQDTRGSVEAYTIYNPASPQTQNFGTYRLRVFRTPDTADTILLQYYRPMDPDATTVDIPDEYINLLIDYAVWRLIRLKDTEDTRLPHLFQVAERALALASTNDEENAEDEQVRMISQMEAWTGERKLWTNGSFYPHASDY